jgi:Ca2+-binding EF-hand superfamily protein
MLTSSVCDATEMDSKYGFYFRMFDINGDGSLSRDEVYNLLCSKQTDLAEKISKVQTILAALDYDGKGYITFDGYVNAANKHPALLSCFDILHG